MTKEDYAKDLIDQGLSEDDFILKMKEYKPDVEDVDTEIDEVDNEIEDVEVSEIENDIITDPPEKEKNKPKYKMQGVDKFFTTEDIESKLQPNETLEDYLKIHKNVYEIKPIEEVEAKISFEDFILG